MHEMGIALQIIDIATASIPQDMRSARVERINLRIGKLAAVVADSLRFCFDIVSKDTALTGAELAIEETPVVARCKDCDARWTIVEPVFTCTACQSGALEILSGRELDIVSIEIAQEESHETGGGQ
ncbi:MAG: hydrogenase maturation nickel metallochaperone HypA [Desulfobacterales bacterium]|jgi:hydrogenase nickel incorporation protein HypA/HybF|nr:hydrogenase maturation nickel metallochaperone HypA [Desulfobacterales bacterium]